MRSSQSYRNIHIHGAFWAGLRDGLESEQVSKVSARNKNHARWGVGGIQIFGLSAFTYPVLPLFYHPRAKFDCCRRDVTAERKEYPSFSPEDFPAVYKAAQKALKTATKAITSDPDSQVKVRISAYDTISAV